MFSLELKLNPFAGKEGIEAEVVKAVECENPGFVELHGQVLQIDQYNALETLAQQQYGKSAEELFATTEYTPPFDAQDGIVRGISFSGKHKTGKLVIPEGLSGIVALACCENELDDIDFSACTNLAYLDCSKNNLIKIPRCTSLIELNCSSNKLNELDVTGYNALTELSCGKNLLSNLDLKGCSALAKLFFGNNKITSLETTNCPDLRILHGYDNLFSDSEKDKLLALEKKGVKVYV